MIRFIPATKSHRIIAYIIDVFVLYLIGLFIYFSLGRYLDGLGAYKIWAGVIISSLYFFLSHTKLMDNQSIGKRVMNIYVRNRKGGNIHWYDALERAILKALPICFYTSIFDISYSSIPEIPIFFSFIIVYHIFDIVYFFINKDALSYHDIVASTYVSSRHSIESYEYYRATARKRYLPITIAILLFMLSLLLNRTFSSISEEQKKDEILIRQKLGVSSHYILENLKVCHLTDQGGVVRKDLELQLLMSFENEATMEESKERLKSDIKDLVDQLYINKIKIETSDKFDIGIFRYTKNAKKVEIAF